MKFSFRYLIEVALMGAIGMAIYQELKAVPDWSSFAEACFGMVSLIINAWVYAKLTDYIGD